MIHGESRLTFARESTGVHEAFIARKPDGSDSQESTNQISEVLKSEAIEKGLIVRIELDLVAANNLRLSRYKRWENFLAQEMVVLVRRRQLSSCGSIAPY